MDRIGIALWIVRDLEERIDARGRIRVYALPANDGGGTPAPGYPHGYEVAGINNGYHPHEAADLAALIQAGRQTEAVERAVEYIANYTDCAVSWHPHVAIQAILRSTVFNRGAFGAAKTLQYAVGFAGKDVDGRIGPKSRREIATFKTLELVNALRQARETYERKHVGVRKNMWKGLVDRWDKERAFALSLVG